MTILSVSLSTITLRRLPDFDNDNDVSELLSFDKHTTIEGGMAEVFSIKNY